MAKRFGDWICRNGVALFPFVSLHICSLVFPQNVQPSHHAHQFSLPDGCHAIPNPAAIGLTDCSFSSVLSYPVVYVRGSDGSYLLAGFGGTVFACGMCFAGGLLDSLVRVFHLPFNGIITVSLP